jgi:UDP-glucose:(heptosyl)LPS alpha-1,3-glucosyltransferase
MPLIKGYRRRRVFAWQCDRFLRRRKYDLVIGHGDALHQDVLFLHNLIHRAHELIPGGTAGKLASAGRFHADIFVRGRFRVCIANSELMRRDLVGRFGISPERIHVAHPGYDPNRFHPDDRDGARSRVRGQLGIEDDVVLLGMITSGDFHKRGLSVLLDSYGKARAELSARCGPKIRSALLVVGKDRVDHYREQARSLGLESDVRFLPPRADVENLFRALDIFVYPAFIEEFGLVVEEAMACGIPVLTTHRVGAAELLGDDPLVAPEPTVEELVPRLVRLITDREQRTAWGRRGRQKVAGNHWQTYVDRVCSIQGM